MSKETGYPGDKPWMFHNQSDSFIQGALSGCGERDEVLIIDDVATMTEEEYAEMLKDYPKSELLVKTLPDEEFKDLVVKADMYNNSEMRTLEDPVNEPSHYNAGNIECIDYLFDNLPHEAYVGYLEGNIKKYLHRWRYKAGVQDLKKAQWYLNRLVEVMED